jgi:hypothetical protein
VPVIARPREEGGYELISGHVLYAISTMTLPPLSWLTAIFSVRTSCPVSAPSPIN